MVSNYDCIFSYEQIDPLYKIVSKSMKHTLFEKQFDPLVVQSKNYFDPLKNLYDLYSVGSKWFVRPMLELKDLVNYPDVDQNFDTHISYFITHCITNCIDTCPSARGEFWD